MAPKIITSDGAAGERYAVALLSIALCAEASHSTRIDDGKKIDVRISLKNAFSERQSIISVQGQIKHGDSYVYNLGSRLRLQNIDLKTITTLQEGSIPAIIVWVPQELKKELYWHIIKPLGKRRASMYLYENNVVSPALRFELSRFFNFNRRNDRYPTLQLNALDDIGSSIIRARSNYKELRSNGLYNSLIGKVVISRFGWRHVTRKSRTTSRRLRSFHVLPYLKHFLVTIPTRYIIDLKSKTIRNGMVYVKNEVVFWYYSAFQIDGETHTLLVRFIEEITYPEDWYNRPLSESEVNQSVKLMSWWYKPE